VTRLLQPKRSRCKLVALDEDAGPAESFAETWQTLRAASEVSERHAR